jgi:hypothetical protein
MGPTQTSKSFPARIPLLVTLAFLSSSLFILGYGSPVAHIPVFDKNDFAPGKPRHAAPGDASYRLIPYDQINVKFTYHPEEDSKSPLMIRP